MAVQHNNKEIIEILVEHNADLTAQDKVYYVCTQHNIMFVCKLSCYINLCFAFKSGVARVCQFLQPIINLPKVELTQHICSRALAELLSYGWPG